MKKSQKNISIALVLLLTQVLISAILLSFSHTRATEVFVFWVSEAMGLLCILFSFTSLVKKESFVGLFLIIFEIVIYMFMLMLGNR